MQYMSKRVTATGEVCTRTILLTCSTNLGLAARADLIRWIALGVDVLPIHTHTFSQLASLLASAACLRGINTEPTDESPGTVAYLARAVFPTTGAEPTARLECKDTLFEGAM